MPMELPDAIAGYVTSANAHDAEGCVRFFTEDAVVHDEGQERHGHASIRAWKEEVSRKYRPIMKAVDMTRNKENIIVTAAVSGDFKGSPIDLRFIFTLRGDKIARLDIAP